jgi:hypothetical protein
MLRSPLLAIALLSSTATPAQDSAGTEPANRDIVVTGQSLQDTADALAACLARNCPPDEDIRLTLAHAENQFVAGNYRDARATTLASLRRNSDEGRAFPIEVSDLYRANGRIAAHLGEARAYQLSVLDMRDTLLDGLPENDARVLAAQIEVGDSRLRLGFPDEARSIYARTARQADTAGHPRVAAFARLRQAMIDLPSDPAARNAGRARQARASLETISGLGETAGADIALMADVMLARIEREEGSMARTQRIVARFSANGGTVRPVLLASEPVRLQDSDVEGEAGGSGNVLSRVTAGVDDRWIDVGFWINADGRVSDYEILRNSGGVGGWTEAVERSVNSRTYAPLRNQDGIGSPGFYVIERYTLTADYQRMSECTGSRIRCRASNLRVERTDLTPEDLSDQPDRAG